ncbi:MAG: hypothetical protein Kow0069_35080 [Promethearchaeota archaeon]
MKTSLSLPKIPEEFYPRIEKFLDQVENHEVPDQTLRDLFMAIFKPGIEVVYQDRKARKSIDEKVPEIVGKRLFLHVADHSIWILTVKEPPALLDVELVPEAELDRLKEEMVGLSIEFEVVRGMFDGTMDPIKAAFMGKGEVHNMGEFSTWALPFVGTLNEITQREDLMQQAMEGGVLEVLDAELKKHGC